jgi:hypothetical protein
MSTPRGAPTAHRTTHTRRDATRAQALNPAPTNIQYRTEEGDIDNVIVAVDAIVAWGDIQWLPASLLRYPFRFFPPFALLLTSLSFFFFFSRDLNKMYCSCWDPTNAIPIHPLATGNWGCGGTHTRRTRRTPHALTHACVQRSEGTSR